MYYTFCCVATVQTVSKEHALLDVSHDFVTLMDLNSSNKTRINDSVININLFYLLLQYIVRTLICQIYFC